MGCDVIAYDSGRACEGCKLQPVRWGAAQRLWAMTVLPCSAHWCQSQPPVRKCLVAAALPLCRAMELMLQQTLQALTLEMLRIFAGANPKGFAGNPLQRGFWLSHARQASQIVSWGLHWRTAARLASSPQFSSSFAGSPGATAFAVHQPPCALHVAAARWHFSFK